MSRHQKPGWVVTLQPAVALEGTGKAEIVVAARRWKWSAKSVIRQRRAFSRAGTIYRVRSVKELPLVIPKEA